MELVAAFGLLLAAFCVGRIYERHMYNEVERLEARFAGYKACEDLAYARMTRRGDTQEEIEEILA